METCAKPARLQRLASGVSYDPGTGALTRPARHLRSILKEETVSYSQLTRWKAVASGLGLLALAVTPAYGQILRKCPPPCDQPAPCPAPELKVPPTAPPTMPPAVPSTPPAAPPQVPIEPTLPTERFAAVGGENVALQAPNMLGNLLNGSHSISFFINRTQGATFVNALGSTNITNPKVADDNSPIPRDRFSFRYNFFHDAQQVTGISSAPGVFNPQLLAFVGATATRNYNVNEYTFQFEKTFLDRLASIELRVPFATGLASKLNLSAANVTGIGQGVDLVGQPLPGIQAIQLVETPQNTLGHSLGTQSFFSPIVRARSVG